MNKDAKQKLSELLDECEFSNWVNKFNAEVKLIEFIDALEPDHPKVKLPREVGEAWIEYVGSRPTGRGIDNLDMALVFLVREECPNDNVQSWYTVTPGAISILSDAYRYGWDAEPEELFYVEAPENWNAAVGQEYRWVSMRGGEFNLTVKGQAQTFTHAQIKEYHLDSDIFTLVPVEDEK